MTQRNFFAMSGAKAKLSSEGSLNLISGGRGFYFSEGLLPDLARAQYKIAPPSGVPFISYVTQINNLQNKLTFGLKEIKSGR